MALRPFALAAALGALMLGSGSAAVAQDEVPAAPAAPADASGVQVGVVSDLLGPGQEGIGPLASAPAAAASEPETQLAETPSPEAAPAPEAPKPAAAKARRHAPAKAVRKSRAHPQG